jgi:hypothetical protein
VALSIWGVNDFIEVLEISDQWQILAISCIIRLCKCASHDVADGAGGF